MNGEDQVNQRRGGLFGKLRMPFGRTVAEESLAEPAETDPMSPPTTLAPVEPAAEAPAESPSEEFARIESILRELDAGPTKPENAVTLSLTTVLGLVPGRYRKPYEADFDPTATVSVAVENLFDQLASGRVAIPLALLVLDLPPELVQSEANKDFTTIVSLPLDEVVAAVDPDALSRGMASLSLSPLVDRLPDPFSAGETGDITLSTPTPRVAKSPASPAEPTAPATTMRPAVPPPPAPAPPKPSPEEVERAARAVPAWAVPEVATGPFF